MKNLYRIIIITAVVSSCAFGRRHMGTWMIDPNVEGWNLEERVACFGCPNRDILIGEEVSLVVEQARPIKNYREYVCIRARFFSDSDEFKFNPNKVEITQNGNPVGYEARSCWDPNSLKYSGELLYPPDEDGNYEVRNDKGDMFYFYIEKDPNTFTRFKIKLNGLIKDGKPYPVPELTVVWDEKIKTRPTQ